MNHMDLKKEIDAADRRLCTAKRSPQLDYVCPRCGDLYSYARKCAGCGCKLERVKS
jgi:hypothetical protein